ncbi:hypothetical protein [Pseudomonas sp. NFX15]|uniref:hypothetical protein n=1 Tax=Pseudomonas sp. NFX15 TaxID=2816958 RepID=UPI003B8AFDFD
MDIHEKDPRKVPRVEDDPQRAEAELPLPADDEAPVDEEMEDVDANNSVSSEHPDP